MIEFPDGLQQMEKGSKHLDFTLSSMLEKPFSRAII